MALIDTLGEIGSAIREKTGETELIPLKEMASVIRDIKTGGQNPFEYATNPNNIFTSSPFPEGSSFEIDLPIATDIAGLFWATKGLKKITVKGNNAGNLIAADNAFRDLPSVEIIDFSDFICKLKRGNTTFYNSKKIKAILGVIDFSEALGYNKSFGYCEALEEVRFKENCLKFSIGFAHSPKLSSNSINSIINGLATVETAQTLTLPKTLSTEAEAVVNANIEEIDGEIRIKGKEGWTLVR